MLLFWRGALRIDQQVENFSRPEEDRDCWQRGCDLYLVDADKCGRGQGVGRAAYSDKAIEGSREVSERKR